MYERFILDFEWRKKGRNFTIMFISYSLILLTLFRVEIIFLVLSTNKKTIDCKFPKLTQYLEVIFQSYQ